MIFNNQLGENSIQKGKVVQKNIMNEFIESLKKFYNPEKIKPYKVVRLKF